MRISDWSSDVCSSDLASHRHADRADHDGGVGVAGAAALPVMHAAVACGCGDVPADAAQGRHDAGAAGVRSALGSAGDPGLPHQLHDAGADDDLCAARSPRSEEHTSELQSLMRISYAVFCLKNTNKNTI